MARKFNAGYYFSEGFHSIFTHGFMSFAAVCMIVACLLIMGSFSLLAVNLNHMLGDLEKENEFLAYVDDSYSEEEARALQSQIEAVPNVSQVTFVSKEEALNQFLEIAIMKMCGATDAFIQWPFVVEGMILGLAGALIAFFAQWGLYQMVGKVVIQGNGLSLFTMLSYGSMARNILGVFCGTGALIGVGGSLLAIRKFLQV